MPTQQITIPVFSTNFSLQVGDLIFFSPTVLDGGFQTTSTVMYQLGTVIDIDTLTIDVIYDDTIFGTCSNCISLPTNGDFLMFEKNKIVNSSNATGYYASVNFVNNSKSKAELFSVGSEISISSK